MVLQYEKNVWCHNKVYSGLEMSSEKIAHTTKIYEIFLSFLQFQ